MRVSTAVRVRFAPSPTGHLHIGGARTFFYNWLFAKKHHGSMVLRIEDTDVVRSSLDSEQSIVQDLKDLGLDFDESPYQNGPYGPYRQSERIDIYWKYAQKLLSEQKAFYCFCSDELLQQKRELALASGAPPHYDGTCHHLTSEAIEEKFLAGHKAVIRFKATKKTYPLQDIVRGTVTFGPDMVGDFVIVREATPNAPGYPVYNFCCVVDDSLMDITHVIRAEEHLSNTLRQLMLFEALHANLPSFAHISLVLNTERQKLSKRSGDVSVRSFLAKGFLPEALLNFILLLGWAPKSALATKSGHPEIFTMDEMIQYFDLNGLQKAGGIFDIQKLLWMNHYYLQSVPRLQDRLYKFLTQHETQHTLLSLPVTKDALWLERVVDLLKKDSSTLLELAHKLTVFLDPSPQLDLDALEALTSIEPLLLERLVTTLNHAIQSFEDDTMISMQTLQQTLSLQLGLKGKALFTPLRILTTGSLHGPELKLALPLLGKALVLSRITANYSHVVSKR